jgi:lysyl-tRNA synthetase class 1
MIDFSVVSRIVFSRSQEEKKMNVTNARAWPFQEARNLLAHIEKKGKKPGDLVTFETGYGPSGAPHIGTFGEVVRTLWVMRAFNKLTNHAYRTRLIMFSDDYDALRKVPDDMPEWMNEHLGKPLTHVPNPYPYEDIPEASFGQANNEKLARFVEPLLQSFDGSSLGNIHQGARYGMVSSSEYYWAGAFNDMLDRVWDNYQAILNILLPTFKNERRSTYSPFMPLSEQGRVINSGVTLGAERGTIICHEGLRNIHDGNAKLQWYVDWAMRWTFFDVDYEMSGKDLMDSVNLSSEICRVLGGTPPLNLTYELFLDEHGAKISKSKGNGFTIEEWLTYGSHGSLMLLMFQNPRAAKKLYRDLVPQLEDQFIKLCQKAEITPDDATWHFQIKDPEMLGEDISYSLMLNLAIVGQTREPDKLLAYLEQGRELSGPTIQYVKEMAPKVIAYAADKGLFDRERREPTSKERQAFNELAARFSGMLENMTAEHYQYQVYEVGKRHGFEPLRSWFRALYECLLGSSDGPRFGAFTQAYGLKNTIALLRQYDIDS